MLTCTRDVPRHDVDTSTCRPWFESLTTYGAGAPVRVTALTAPLIRNGLLTAWVRIGLLDATSVYGFTEPALIEQPKNEATPWFPTEPTGKADG